MDGERIFLILYLLGLSGILIFGDCGEKTFAVIMFVFLVIIQLMLWQN